jgi:hypothetical protein
VLCAAGDAQLERDDEAQLLFFVEDESHDAARPLGRGLFCEVAIEPAFVGKALERVPGDLDALLGEGLHKSAPPALRLHGLEGRLRLGQSAKNEVEEVDGVAAQECGFSFVRHGLRDTGDQACSFVGRKKELLRERSSDQRELQREFAPLFGQQDPQLRSTATGQRDAAAALPFALGSTFLPGERRSILFLELR